MKQQENKISSLDGIESLSALSSLALQQNNVSVSPSVCCVKQAPATYPPVFLILVSQIDSLEALEKLSLLPNLSDLELSGNPVAEIENYRLLLILQLPSLKKLDGVVITEDERLATADLKQQREEAEIAASAMEDEA